LNPFVETPHLSFVQGLFLPLDDGTIIDQETLLIMKLRTVGNDGKDIEGEEGGEEV
jgi:hypothetical protein